MKKLLIAITLALLAATMSARTSKESIPCDKLLALINEFNSQDNFEVVKVGSLGTSTIKSIVKLSAKETCDKETREILKILNGIRKIAIVDYEDCTADVRSRFTGRLDKILASSDLLIETKDGDDIMKIYGVVNNDASIVRDFVMYVPSDCALICLFGSIPMDAISVIAAK